MPAESDQSKTLQAQKIACTNNAAFVMNFSVGYSKKQDGSGGDIGGSGDYPINQTRTIDLLNQGLQVGDSIWPKVNAVWGKSNEGERIAYAPNGHTVTYNVSGTTLSYGVDRIA
jgi:hypothetical protein